MVESKSKSKCALDLRQHTPWTLVLDLDWDVLDSHVRSGRGGARDSPGGEPRTMSRSAGAIGVSAILTFESTR